ncbi:MAG: thrombospondin type 3 repeat-containing protein, partial [bacterium]
MKLIKLILLLILAGCAGGGSEGIDEDVESTAPVESMSPTVSIISPSDNGTLLGTSVYQLEFSEKVNGLSGNSLPGSCGGNVQLTSSVGGSCHPLTISSTDNVTFLIDPEGILTVGEYQLSVLTSEIADLEGYSLIEGKSVIFQISDNTTFVISNELEAKLVAENFDSSFALAVKNAAIEMSSQEPNDLLYVIPAAFEGAYDVISNAGLDEEQQAKALDVVIQSLLAKAVGMDSTDSSSATARIGTLSDQSQISSSNKDLGILGSAEERSQVSIDSRTSVSAANSSVRILGSAEYPSRQKKGFRAKDTGGRIKVDLNSLDSLNPSGSISYQWFADGVEIPGATSQELVTTDYTKYTDEADIHAQITYTTLDGSSETVESSLFNYYDWRIHTGAEDNTLIGDNPTPFWETFSYDMDSSNHYKNGDKFKDSKIHSIEPVLASEAGIESGDGAYVIKIRADGRKFGSKKKWSFSKRSELGNRDWNTRIRSDSEVFYSASIYFPSEYWDQKAKYSIIIMQHKQYGGGEPNFALRLSNTGDYKLFLQSKYHLAKKKANAYHIATLQPDHWHDLRVHLKPARKGSGFLNIYLDGERVFDYEGTTLKKSTDGSYLKIGMYTQIRDERVIYFDNVQMSNKIHESVESWVETAQRLNADSDKDGFVDAGDAFPNDPLESTDTDGDGLGNNTDIDDDGDGFADAVDNCPLEANTDQLDTDSDLQGDVCDSDDDGDSVADYADAFPLDPLKSVDRGLSTMLSSLTTAVATKGLDSPAMLQTLIESLVRNLPALGVSEEEIEQTYSETIVQATTSAVLENETENLDSHLEALSNGVIAGAEQVSTVNVDIASIVEVTAETLTTTAAEEDPQYVVPENLITKLSALTEGNSSNSNTEKLRILGSATKERGVKGVLFADIYGVFDLDTNKVYTFQWFSDGNAISGATAQRLEVGDYLSWVENKDITVELTYTNTSGQQTTVESGKMPYTGFRVVANAEVGRNEWQAKSVEEAVSTSSNPFPLKESYSPNGTSSTSGSGSSPGSAHNITSLLASDEGITAREGDSVIRIYAKGSRSNRSELAHLNNETAFKSGEDYYFSGSFYISRAEWDPVTEFSTVITQLKQYGGGDPNFELRLSNLGDYKMQWRSRPHSVDYTDIGYANADAWNDLKIYTKHSQGADGIFQVWLNGQQVVDYSGPTMYRNADGYIKFGMYTNINDERVIYWDAIDISDHLTMDFNTWLRSFDTLPSITVSSVSDGQQFASSDDVVISGSANDPAGEKLGSWGGIRSVELFDGNTSLRTLQNMNFNFSNLNLSNGGHTLRLVATDTDGNTAQETLNIWIGNRPADISIDSDTYLIGSFDTSSSVVLSATASDRDGSVVKVEFLIEGEVIGTAVNNSGDQYTLNWTPLTPGAYSIQAQAMDNQGAISLSDSKAALVGTKITAKTLTAIQDVSIMEGEQNRTGNWSETEVNGSPTSPKVALVEFDLSDISNAKFIESAIFKPYVSYLKNEPGTFSIYEAGADSWNQTSATWVNTPDKGAFLDTITINRKGRVSFDVTDALQNAIDAGRSKVTLWIEDSEREQQRFDFYSENKPNPPELIVSSATLALPQFVKGSYELDSISDTTSPTFQSAAIPFDGNKVILDYDEALSATTAAPSDFVVNVDGSAATISSVATSGSSVELTLSSAITFGQTIMVAYTDPTSGNDANAIQDAAGNDASLLSTSSVTNNSTLTPPDTTAPLFSSAVTSIDGTQIILSYNEALSSTTAAPSDFVVNVDGSAATISSVATSGSSVELTLSSAITFGQTIMVAYTDPTSGNDANAIQDAAGNDASLLSTSSVTNNSTLTPPDTTAPLFSSAVTSIDGTQIILSYNEALSSTTAAPSDFVVNVDGSAVSISSVVTSNSTVMITLASAVTTGQSVTVAYTDPSSSNDSNATQDVSGNDAASLESTIVTNNSTLDIDTAAPTFSYAVASFDGIQVFLVYDEGLSTTIAETSAFTVNIEDSEANISSVETSGSTVVLTLTAVITTGQSVTVSYTDPSSSDDVNAIQDSVGNDAGSLSSTSVTNLSVADDSDGDGVYDTWDNCPTDPNTNQFDTDGDDQGDVCDADDDADGVLDTLDNCPLEANTDQSDKDSDGRGDTCDFDDDGDLVIDQLDNCPLDVNSNQLDGDGDGQGDVCDTDLDNDNIANDVDNCPLEANTNQLDSDGDGQGNICDSDDDGDTIVDSLDNCPLNANTSQSDSDGDGIGNVCDSDNDNDGVADSIDAFPLDSSESVDTDSDGIGNNGDSDDDGDGVADSSDAFPLDSSEAVDTDSDGIGDNSDNCPSNANANQADSDGDGQGNVCDSDNDNDGVADSYDAFPSDPSEWVDTDRDGIGNNADSDDDGDGVADSSDA